MSFKKIYNLSKKTKPELFDALVSENPNKKYYNELVIQYLFSYFDDVSVFPDKDLRIDSGLNFKKYQQNILRAHQQAEVYGKENEKYFGIDYSLSMFFDLNGTANLVKHIIYKYQLLKNIKTRNDSLSILDLGSGSGILSMAALIGTLKAKKDKVDKINIHAFDISQPNLNLQKRIFENDLKNKVFPKKIELYSYLTDLSKSDWLKEIPKDLFFIVAEIIPNELKCQPINTKNGWIITNKNSKDAQRLKYEDPFPWVITNLMNREDNNLGVTWEMFPNIKTGEISFNRGLIYLKPNEKNKLPIGIFNQKAYMDYGDFLSWKSIKEYLEKPRGKFKRWV